MCGLIVCLFYNVFNLYLVCSLYVYFSVPLVELCLITFLNSNNL